MGRISPPACQTLFDQIDGWSSKETKSASGYRHPDRDSYLLVLESDGRGDLADALATNAANCPQMTMQYGGAKITYDIGIESKREQSLQLSMKAVDDTNEQIVEMALVACSDSRTDTLVRVMNSRGLDNSDRAMATALAENC